MRSSHPNAQQEQYEIITIGYHHIHVTSAHVYTKILHHIQYPISKQLANNMYMQIEKHMPLFWLNTREYKKKHLAKWKRFIIGSIRQIDDDTISVGGEYIFPIHKYYSKMFVILVKIQKPQWRIKATTTKPTK